MADTGLEENKCSSCEQTTQLNVEKQHNDEENKTCETSKNSNEKEDSEQDNRTDSIRISNNDIETLEKFEEMFKDRFTEHDPGYVPYKSSNDAKAIPIVENFQPPWNSQNRDGHRGRGHGSHHQQNRYKRRHDEYRSYDNRQRRNNYQSNYHDERHRRQNHGFRQHEQSNYGSRDQWYRRY